MCEKCDRFKEHVQEDENLMRAKVIAGVVYYVLQDSGMEAQLIQLAMAMAMLGNSSRDDAHNAVEFAYVAREQAQELLDERDDLDESEIH